MQLLALESTNDDLVQKSSLTGVSKVNTSGIPKTSRGDLIHSATSTSLNSMASSKSAPPIITNLDGGKDDKIMYPFRIKHLGKTTYVLYAQSAQVREDWCNKIIEAKTRYAQSLFKQNAEPFNLKVVADAAFAYESSYYGQAGITIQGTPLDRAVKEVEALYVNSGRPSPVCRSRVNCATSFRSISGKEMVAVGADNGVYVSEVGMPRTWVKVSFAVYSGHTVTNHYVRRSFPRTRLHK